MTDYTQDAHILQFYTIEYYKCNLKDYFIDDLIDIIISNFDCEMCESCVNSITNINKGIITYKEEYLSKYTSFGRTQYRNEFNKHVEHGINYKTIWPFVSLPFTRQERSKHILSPNNKKQILLQEEPKLSVNSHCDLKLRNKKKNKDKSSIKNKPNNSKKLFKKSRNHDKILFFEQYEHNGGIYCYCDNGCTKYGCESYLNKYYKPKLYYQFMYL
jgi:hypothetical protein